MKAKNPFENFSFNKSNDKGVNGFSQVDKNVTISNTLNKTNLNSHFHHHLSRSYSLDSQKLYSRLHFYSTLPLISSLFHFHETSKDCTAKEGSEKIIIRKAETTVNPKHLREQVVEQDNKIWHKILLTNG